MGVLDTDDLGKLAGATRDEINLFVNTGFAEDEMGRGLAVKIMEEVVKSRLNKVRNGKIYLTTSPTNADLIKSFQL